MIMITAEIDMAAWALLVTGLDEASEHLRALVEDMTENGKVDPEDFAVQLGHIYAHLNRAWNSRNRTNEISPQEWSKFSAFPTDLETCG